MTRGVSVFVKCDTNRITNIQTQNKHVLIQNILKNNIDVIDYFVGDNVVAVVVYISWMQVVRPLCPINRK